MQVVHARLLPDGGLVVGGRAVAVPAGMTAEETALARVRGVVETLGQPAQMEIERADGSAVVLVVDVDGAVSPLTAPVPAQPTAQERPELPLPRLLEGARSPAPAPADPVSVPDDAPTELRPTPGGRRLPPRGRETRTVLPREPTREPPRRRRGLVVGGTVLALVVGGLAATSLGGGDSGPSTSTAGVAQGLQLRVAVPGWSRSAVWSVPAPVPRRGVTSVVAGRAGVVALTPDGAAVTLLDMRDGHTISRTTLPTDGPLHGLWSTSSLAAVHVGTHVLLLPVDGVPAPVRTVEVPPGSRLSTMGDSLLITYPSNGALVLDPASGRLVDVRLPSGTTQLAADGTTIIAAMPAGSWWLARPGAAATEVHAVPPREGARVRQVRGGGHGRVLILWSGPGDGMTTVAMHDANTGAVLLSADAQTVDLVNAAWRWDGGPLAAYGPVVLDVARGSAHLVPGLDPEKALDGTVYGRRGASEGVAVAAADPNRVVSLGHDAPLPWGGRGDRLVILDTDSTGTLTLFGLERS